MEIKAEDVFVESNFILALMTTSSFALSSLHYS